MPGHIVDWAGWLRFMILGQGFHIIYTRCPQHAKLVGRNSKDEAYYFLEDVDMGPHPETFFGVHPYIHEEKKYDILLPYLVEWKDDLILRHSRAYLNVPGEGFLCLPAFYMRPELH
ncbi:MAG: hypothetical protein U5N58_11875 [Actinomycetota bacterium]|nr:hypothetical protein [Actinomycetota bacterium]